MQGRRGRGETRRAGAGTADGRAARTAAGWIEGGTPGHLPGGLGVRLGDFGRPQAKRIDAEPALPADREERYSVAVLEVQYQSFHARRAPASLPAPPAAGAEGQSPRQLEGPAAEQQAA